MRSSTLGPTNPPPTTTDEGSLCASQSTVLASSTACRRHRQVCQCPQRASGSRHGRRYRRKDPSGKILSVVRIARVDGSPTGEESVAKHPQPVIRTLIAGTDPGPSSTPKLEASTRLDVLSPTLLNSGAYSRDPAGRDLVLAIHRRTHEVPPVPERPAAERPTFPRVPEDSQDMVVLSPDQGLEEEDLNTGLESSGRRTPG